MAVSESSSPSASISPSASPSPSPAEMDIVWGHDTGVLEAVVHDFSGYWTGTGTIENPGVADTERVALDDGEYMISEVVHTGAVSILLDYNVYAAGDTVDFEYRHGATPAACEGAAWNTYSAPFVSLGYVQIRIGQNAAPPSAFLLKEDGAYLLLETGGRIILENVGGDPSGSGLDNGGSRWRKNSYF